MNEVYMYVLTFCHISVQLCLAVSLICCMFYGKPVLSKQSSFKVVSEHAYTSVLLRQKELSCCRAGIEAACPGGEIVYSTCTLSQVQNQSVVEQAVSLALEERGIQLQVSETHAVSMNSK